MAIDLNDKTSNGNTLVNHGATEVNTALPFAASTIAVDMASAGSAYITVPDAAQLSIPTSGSLTIEFWAKVTSLNDSNWVVFKGNTGQYEYGIRVGRADGAVDSYTYDGAGAGIKFGNISGSVIGTGTWYHIAVCWDNTLAYANSNGKLYVGTVESTSTTTGSDRVLTNGTQEMDIGLRVDQTRYYNGKVDDFRVWKSVRTLTEITNNMSIQLAGTETNLVAYYPFESLSAPSVARSITYLSMMGVGS